MSEGDTGSLILPDWLVTAATEPPRAEAGIRIVDSRVDAVGTHAELLAAHPDDAVHRAEGRVALPGFVNAHVHQYGVLAHGIPVEDAPTGFWTFLDDFWWPKVEDALDVDMIAAAAEWVGAEMLRSGTTTFYDILEAPNAIPEALIVEKEVAERRGIRAVLSFEATERAGPDIAELGLAENVALIEACRGERSELVSGAMCWHTAFTCSADYVRRAFALAEEYDVFAHAHCNEGVHEPEWCEANIGVRTFEHYDDIGVAGPRLLASQCVQLSDNERAIIADRGVRVSHMPLANCEVGGGIAPIPELLDAGVTVGLGSDGYINDFYEVMRGAFLLHKARLLNPSVMPASAVLHLATEGGAMALGIPDVGRLEPGYRADVQLVDCSFPTPPTTHNLAEQLVLFRNGSNVTDVVVDGEWRVSGGEVVDADLDVMRAAVHKQAERLWSRA